MALTSELLVQTQALIDRSYVSILISLGYIKTQEISIVDTYYVSEDDIDFPIHTYEKAGNFIRVRNGVTELHTINLEHSINPHRVRTVQKLNEDTIRIELKKNIEIENIIKTREVWQNKDIRIYIDYYESNTILEISESINDIKNAMFVAEKQTDLLLRMGIESSQIINDSYIYRKIHYKLKNNPKIKIELLENEIKELTKRLRKKEMLSGEAFKDTGDGWHENPTYETLYHEILTLNSMIIDAKETLIALKNG